MQLRFVQAFHGKEIPDRHNPDGSECRHKKAGNVSVNIALDKLDTDSDWETYTSVSGKYKQVSVEDVINRLLKL